MPSDFAAKLVHLHMWIHSCAAPSDLLLVCKYEEVQKPEPKEDKMGTKGSGCMCTSNAEPK